MSVRARVAFVLAGLLILIFVIGLFPNEPLRRSIEGRMNRSLKGYTASIGRARLQPLGGSVSLENLVVRQNEHPEPPVLSLPLLHASVHWKELLFLRLVADFRLDRPQIHANLAQLRQEAADPTPTKQKGWQQAFEAIFPLKINQLRIENGSITYVDADEQRPLELTRVNLRASNIRNIHSKERTYPSQIEGSAVVFQTGRARLKGDADFLAEPYAGVKGQFQLTGIPLDALGPVGEHWHVLVSGGTLTAAGDVEYAPNLRSLKMPEITIDGARLGYLRPGPPNPNPVPASPAKTIGPKSAEPPWSLALDRFRMRDSRLELVDRSRDPAFRIFVSRASVDVDGLANEPPGHVARAVVKGRFMDQGDVTANASFQPGQKSADLDLKIVVGRTDLTRLNDVFRAYGNFDVAAGTMELFSEIAVHRSYLTGYVKPIFYDVQIYDPRQEANKGFLKKVYERAVDTASKIFKNHKRDQIATNVPIEGPVGNTRSSFFEALGGILENAFIRAILPGFEREVGVGPGTKR